MFFSENQSIADDGAAEAIVDGVQNPNANGNGLPNEPNIINKLANGDNDQELQVEDGIFSCVCFTNIACPFLSLNPSHISTHNSIAFNKFFAI